MPPGRVPPGTDAPGTAGLALPTAPRPPTEPPAPLPNPPPEPAWAPLPPNDDECVEAEPAPVAESPKPAAIVSAPVPETSCWACSMIGWPMFCATDCATSAGFGPPPVPRICCTTPES